MVEHEKLCRSVGKSCSVPPLETSVQCSLDPFFVIDSFLTPVKMVPGSAIVHVSGLLSPTAMADIHIRGDGSSPVV